MGLIRVVNSDRQPDPIPPRRPICTAHLGTWSREQHILACSDSKGRCRGGLGSLWDTAVINLRRKICKIHRKAQPYPSSRHLCSVSWQLLLGAQDSEAQSPSSPGLCWVGTKGCPHQRGPRAIASSQWDAAWPCPSQGPGHGVPEPGSSGQVLLPLWSLADVRSFLVQFSCQDET